MDFFALYPDGLPIKDPVWEIGLSESDILRKFYADVCTEAEKIMQETNTVSGAHFNAMKRVLKRKGIEAGG